MSQEVNDLNNLQGILKTQYEPNSKPTRKKRKFKCLSSK